MSTDWSGGRNVKKVHHKTDPLAYKVDGCVGSDKIAHMWQEHYKALLNSVNTPKRPETADYSNATEVLSNITITPDQVSKGVKALKRGKCCGSDGIAAEHWIHASKGVCVYLSLLFTSFLTHGYLPAAFLKSAIVPLIKNRYGDTSDKNNYRPMALRPPVWL